jgi:hypothetical protein
LLNKSKLSVPRVSAIMVLLTLVSAMSVGAAMGAPTTVTAYKSSIAVNVKGTYSASQWTDTAMLTDPTSGITFAVKQNGTGWLFLMIWKQSAFYCNDTNCFGGIELGYPNNTQVMGGPSTPTIMILSSPSFKGGVDEFVSAGEQTPSTVESLGYKTQSVCGLTVASGVYTAECYRPFTLSGASPYDFPKLGVGSTIELGFAVGEFNNPGDHGATDMSSYVLTFSASTYSGSTTSSSTSSSSTTSSTTTSSTTSSTTTSSTTKSSSSSTSSSTSSTTSSSSTASSSTSSTTSSSSTGSTTTSSTSTSTFTSPVTAVSVSTNSGSYVGTPNGVISGVLTGASYGYMVTLTVTSPAGTVVFADSVTVGANGAYNDTFHPGVSNLWVSGTYSVKASYGSFHANSTFSYTPASAVTTTVTSTTISPTTITSVATSTLVSTTTATVTSTGTNTSSSSVPSWAYAAMVVLLILGLVIGYVVAGSRSRTSAA